MSKQQTLAESSRKKVRHSVSNHLQRKGSIYRKKNVGNLGKKKIYIYITGYGGHTTTTPAARDKPGSPVCALPFSPGCFRQFVENVLVLLLLTCL